MNVESEAALRDSATAWWRALGVEMRLSALGATEADLAPWAQEARAIRRLMDNNPRDLSMNQVLALYRAAF
jgi:alcohol dehydrogenase class IV